MTAYEVSPETPRVQFDVVVCGSLLLAPAVTRCGGLGGHPQRLRGIVPLGQRDPAVAEGLPGAAWPVAELDGSGEKVVWRGAEPGRPTPERSTPRALR